MSNLYEENVRMICSYVASNVDGIESTRVSIGLLRLAGSLDIWRGFSPYIACESRDAMLRAIHANNRGPNGWRIIGEYRKAMNRDH